MSIKEDPSFTRPLMVIGQVETVLKQYSFSQKCWLGPGRETEFLPQSNGYSIMKAGFVSRSLRVGFPLYNNEFQELNNQRMGNEWGYHLSKNKSRSIYGSTKE